ncbi:hypothetical protein A2982_00550 [candidate division WWE3 bacterium RIFCSPLOWO2_01_FULL_39_13]|uniref:Terminase small subunit n=1 Tax=candidate division WWE3 bacterium RIFCSPLOWO2_01_FULL_39_13 TaxID=1802624 RepID=A0A1F4V3L1_UNCKA|nr:MAG: hypothetical protein A2982_00550 [candidate division WWE3 bacterium RIFCSPLOWO2_01_FULL_39_13]
MAGRPTVITKQILGKLREAFLLGCTDEEACLYADIHPDTLYAYQKKNPAYSEEKQQLKMKPVLLARQTVIKAIKTDPSLAFKYLERKKKDEFSTKQILDVNTHEDRITGITYVIPDSSLRLKDHVFIANSEYKEQKITES